MGAVFDVSVRALSCINCGAPLTTPPTAGTATCEHCGSLLEFEARREETERADTPPLPDAAYDVQRYIRESGTEGKPWADTIGLHQRTWDEARADPGRDGGYPLFASTLVLTSGQSAAGDHLRRRATLETALELLPDRGHRCVIRCHLARAAAKLGEFDAADAWFATCDTRDVAASVAEEFRITEAALARSRGNHARVLELVPDLDRPMGIGSTLGAQLRVDALEHLHRPAHALAELRAGVDRYGASVFVGWMSVNGFAPKTRAALGSRGRRLGLWIVLLLLGLGAAAFWLARA